MPALEKRALTVPEIKEIINNKRKEVWKLPDN